MKAGEFLKTLIDHDEFWDYERSEDFEYTEGQLITFAEAYASETLAELERVKEEKDNFAKSFLSTRDLFNEAKEKLTQAEKERDELKHLILNEVNDLLPPNVWPYSEDDLNQLLTPKE